MALSTQDAERTLARPSPEEGNVSQQQQHSLGNFLPYIPPSPSLPSEPRTNSEYEFVAANKHRQFITKLKAKLRTLQGEPNTTNNSGHQGPYGQWSTEAIHAVNDPSSRVLVGNEEVIPHGEVVMAGTASGSQDEDHAAWNSTNEPLSEELPPYEENVLPDGTIVRVESIEPEEDPTLEAEGNITKRAQFGRFVKTNLRKYLSFCLERRDKESASENDPIHLVHILENLEDPRPSPNNQPLATALPNSLSQGILQLLLDAPRQGQGKPVPNNSNAVFAAGPSITPVIPNHLSTVVISNHHLSFPFSAPSPPPLTLKINSFIFTPGTENPLPDSLSHDQKLQIAQKCLLHAQSDLTRLSTIWHEAEPEIYPPSTRTAPKPKIPLSELHLAKLCALVEKGISIVRVWQSEVQALASARRRLPRRYPPELSSDNDNDIDLLALERDVEAARKAAGLAPPPPPADIKGKGKGKANANTNANAHPPSPTSAQPSSEEIPAFRIKSLWKRARLPEDWTRDANWQSSTPGASGPHRGLESPCPSVSPSPSALPHPVLRVRVRRRRRVLGMEYSGVGASGLFEQWGVQWQWQQQQQQQQEIRASNLDLDLPLGESSNLVTRFLGSSYFSSSSSSSSGDDVGDEDGETGNKGDYTTGRLLAVSTEEMDLVGPIRHAFNSAPRRPGFVRSTASVRSMPAVLGVGMRGGVATLQQSRSISCLSGYTTSAAAIRIS